LFEALFTPDAPVIVNFHGYSSAVKQLLYGRNASARFTINGYREEGTTTTPFRHARAQPREPLSPRYASHPRRGTA
jgi:phosphoketolase